MLEVISAGMTMSEAAAAAGISRTVLWQWRQDDAEFNAAFEQAYAAGTDTWEQEGRKRAWEGDTALFIFLMKARDPQRFNRKMIAVGGDASMGPIGIAVDERVHFYMPSNGRDQPEVLDDESPIIEGDVEAA